MQNVGNFNAKPIASSDSKGFTQFTMDDAGIASGGAFLSSELEKRDPLIRQPLKSLTYPRDINVKVGGGWVDFTSALSVSYGVTGGSKEGVVAAGGANGLPIVQASMDKGLFKAHNFAVALRIMFIDMQKANFIGRSLDQLLQEGVRLTYDKHMDANVYVGIEDFGTTGLVNNPDVVETTVAGNGQTSPSTKWVDKTQEQILADINNAITQVWAQSDYDESAIPNHIIMPYEQYNYLVSTPSSTLMNGTIMDFIRKSNVAAENGGSLFIGGTKWCKGAGTSSADRMVVYVNHVRFVKVEELVPLTKAMTQPNAANFCYDTAYAANISEVELYYPTSIGYFDGI